jgi:small conductance mechanosensitive channel
MFASCLRGVSSSSATAPARRQVVWRHIATFAAVLLLTLTVGLSPALAADQAKPEADAVSAKEVERLIKTLEDDQARSKLIGDLKALRVAQKRREDAETGLASKALGAVTNRIEALGEQILEASNALTDAPKLVRWVNDQLGNPVHRARWLEVIGKLVGLLAAGLALERIVVLMLKRPRERIAARQTTSRWARVPLLLGWSLLEAAPLLGFVVAVYGFTPLLTMKGDAPKAARLLVGAYVTARLSLMAARIILLPKLGGLRLLPLDEETARYLYIWARRLVGVSMYGWVILAAARLLGLPGAGYDFLLKLLALLVTALVAILILQNRQPVAQWLRRRGDKGMLGARLAQLRNRFADIWHILATLYIAAIYVIWALRIEGGFDYVIRASVSTVAILIAAGLLTGTVRRLIDRAFTVSQEWRQDFPQLERRANRYLPLLHGLLRAAVGVGVVAAVLQVWGLDAVDWMTSSWGRRVLSSALTIGLVLVIALVVWESVSSAVERYLTATGADGVAVERSARARTLLPLLRNALMVVLAITVSLVVLSELGVNIAPLLAGAGVVGLAIGFGSQKLVQDLITGAFILFEDTIAVGDIVKLGEHAGVVEAMSIRTIRLRDVTGTVHTVPFSAVSTVMNLTKNFSYAVFDVGVGYRENTDEVVEVLHNLGAELQADPEFAKLILEPIEVLGVDRLDASEVVLKARLKTVASKQWQVGREFRRRMKQRFDELGIEIPFPQTTVSFAEDKTGQAAPLRMRIERGAAGRKALPGTGTPPHRADVGLPTAHDAGLRRDDADELEDVAGR